MKIKAKDLDMLIKLMQEERHQHGSSGWADQIIEIEQTEENIKEGNLLSSLKISLAYSVKRKNYNNKEFIRDYVTTIELFDVSEKQKIQVTKVIKKESDDDS